jgi:unsaturated chondroitin disaccharide hydrolase
MTLPTFFRLGCMVLTAGACLAQVAQAAGQQEKSLTQIADEQFAFAAQQYKGLLRQMEGDKTRQPRTIEKGRLKAVGPRDWVSGFFPGSLWLIYEHTGSAEYKAAAEDFTARQESIKDFTGHHDVGFMLYCSYGQGYRLTGKPEYKDVLVQGARSLSKRYSPTVGLIRSWDGGPWKYPVIIDNMMNLELLIFAQRQTSEQSFGDIAFSHADKTLANHFRPDGSSFHLLDYDPATGAVTKKQTVQGHADGSAWARGQAWGLYGFTRMAALTKKPEYLDQAQKIADFIVAHPRLPADGVPYWDYDVPNIPDAIRDASAGAITCSALFELAELTGGERGARYKALAEKQLRTLSTAAFRAGLDENGNFLLMHSVGHMSAKVEIDVPLVYADYYYLEALSRYATKKVKPAM